MMVEYWTREALAWSLDITGSAPEVEVWWAAPGVLARRVMVDGEAVSLSRRIG